MDDVIVTAFQFLLREQFPHMKGLQPPSLGVSLTMNPLGSHEFVQVINIGDLHWATISTVGCHLSTVKVFDSLHWKLNDNNLKLVAGLMQSQDNKINIEYVDVQKQTGTSDCGFFALAFATSICYSQDPEKLTYKQDKMREHIFNCFQENCCTPFPSTVNRSHVKPTKKSVSIYCTCRSINDGTKMIQCDECRQWYDVNCIKVDTKFLNNSKLKWCCSKCQGYNYIYNVCKLRI